MRSFSFALALLLVAAFTCLFGCEPAAGCDVASVSAFAFVQPSVVVQQSHCASAVAVQSFAVQPVAVQSFAFAACPLVVQRSVVVQQNVRVRERSGYGLFPLRNRSVIRSRTVIR